MYLFFDTETGGLTPDYSLLTLSAIATDADFNIVPACGFDPGVYVCVKHDPYVTHPRAMEVNQLNLADHDAHGFTLAETKEVLLAYLAEARKLFGVKKFVPAGHNFPFDLRFIQAQLLPDREWGEYFTHPALDTCAVARFLVTGGMVKGSCALPNLRAAFGVETGTAHNAENDNLAAIALAKKFRALVFERRANSAGGLAPTAACISGPAPQSAVGS
jgi:DNA polymerase III alpha subunit (gram-positive type)